MNRPEMSISGISPRPLATPEAKNQFFPGQSGSRPMADIVELFPEETQTALREVLDSLTAEERASLKGKMDGLRVEEGQFSRDGIAEELVGFLKEIQDTRLRTGTNGHGLDVQA